jgi:hypothetical protein
MNCGKCKSEFGEGNFCITCGASADQASEETQLAAKKRDYLEELVLLINRSLQGIKDFSSKVAQTFVILVIEPIQAFYRYSMAHRTRSALVGSLVFLLSGWLISQAAIISGNGPEQTASRYVTAIKNGDFKALSDSSLFPGSSITPAAIQAAWVGESVQDTDFKVVSSEDGKAVVEISEGTNTYTIHLVAKPKQYFIYSIPEWSVQEAAPIAMIQISPTIDRNQLVSFDSNAGDQFRVGDLKTQFLQGFNLLPGYYQTTVSALGFNEKTTTETVVFGLTKKWLAVKADTISVPTSVMTSARTKARAAAVSCAKSKCKAAPKYDASDFSLWSQFVATGYNYTSSRFDYKLQTPTCSAPSFEATSAFKAQLVFDCDGTARGHLYVRYVYYRGYYSDYYYYWNFYDTTSYNLSTALSLSTDGKGKFTLGGARVR